MATLYVHVAGSKKDSKQNYHHAGKYTDDKSWKERDQEIWYNDTKYDQDHFYRNFSPRHRRYADAERRSRRRKNQGLHYFNKNRSPYTKSTTSHFFGHRSPRHIKQAQYERQQNQKYRESLSSDNSYNHYGSLYKRKYDPSPSSLLSSPSTSLSSPYPINQDYDDNISTTATIATTETATTAAFSSNIPVPPPPTLYFPLNDETETDISGIPTTPKPPPDLLVHEQIHNSDHEDMDEHSKMMMAQNLASIPPPLSALRRWTNGKLLFNVEGIEILSKLNISEIENILNEQRLKNEELLTKLNGDQKNFVKVLKHYERKNDKLGKGLTEYEHNHQNTVQDAKMMQYLISDHQKHTLLLQQEDILCDQVQDELYKGVTLNNKLLAEVNLLTQTVDQHHSAIARLSRKLKQGRNAMNMEQKDEEKQENQDKQESDELSTNAVKVEEEEGHDDDKKDSEQEHDGNVMEETEDTIINETDAEDEDTDDESVDDDAKVQDIETASVQTFDTQSVMSLQTDFSTMSTLGVYDGVSPMKKYADKLVARNKKYKQVLEMMRKRVDELRSYRKKL